MLAELKVKINEVGCCSCLAREQEELTSGTTKWSSGKWSEHGISWGGGIFWRRSDLGNNLGIVLTSMPCHLFRAVLMRWDTCCDLGADQNLTILYAPASSFSEFQTDEGSKLISSLAWEVMASFVLWRRAIEMTFRTLSLFRSWSGWGQLAN